MDDFAQFGALMQPNEEDKKRATMMGLLQAGAAILANNNNRNAGAAIGAGGLAGLSGYQGVLASAPKERLANTVGAMQMQKLQRDMAQQKKLQGMQFNDPRAQALAAAGDYPGAINAQYPAPDVWTGKPGDVRFKNGQQIGAVPAKPTEHVINGQLVVDGKPTLTVPKQPDMASDLLIPGPNGQLVPNAALIEAKKGIAKSGATNVNVSTEKKYGEQFGGLVAKADVDLRDTAMKAPALAERANSVKETLASGKVITGTGADYRLALGKALNLVGASDAETIANTETLSTNLAQNTLDAIKASGLGSGNGFSNADRDFLEKAAGGKITLEATTIGRLADLAHKSAAGTAERWNSRVKMIPKTAIEGTGISTDPIQVPQLRSGGAKPAQGGIRRFNKETGRIE